MDKPSYLNFERSKYAWRTDVDDREHTGLYRVGKGEQGVLNCEPYKGELAPLWRFKTPEIATESSRAMGDLQAVPRLPPPGRLRGAEHGQQVRADGLHRRPPLHQLQG